jgi:hypothetical protein
MFYQQSVRLCNRWLNMAKLHQQAQTVGVIMRLDSLTIGIEAP